MTLQQLTVLKRWHVAHKRRRPVEFQAWDTMLTLWVMGWVGVPAALILWQPIGVLACLLCLCAPSAYVAGRLHLHRRGRLRCDWFGLIEVSRPPVASK